MGEFFVWLVLMFAPADSPCLILAALDEARATAYARQSPTDLQNIYASKKAAASDQKILSGFIERDVRVDRLHTVREECVHEPEGKIWVRERLDTATVVLPDGTSRRLPSSAGTERRIRLTHEGCWRIAQVTTLTP